ARFDIHNDPKFSVDFAKLITRISQTVDQDSEKIEISYSKHPNIAHYHGSAKFVSPKVIEINGEHISADKIFIAVGTRPQIPNISGLKGTPFMTSTEALRTTKLPKVMAIVGGGYIATEIGHAYRSLGCETHFLVRSKLLRQEDAQVSEEFTRVFSQHHTVHLNAVPTRIHYHEHMFTVTYEQDGWEENLQCDALLIATGITSNADTLALERTGIQVDENNFIKVDNHLRTTVDGIYAMGDCIGRYFFRHSVNFEGEYLFNEIFGSKSGKPIVYPPIPHAVFSHPQVAAVGKTEEQLKKENIPYIVGINPYRSSAMGMALLSDHGFCKLLIEKETRRILGCHIIGDEASNMIHLVIAMMSKDGTLEDLLNMVYIHPALPEIVRNAARKAKAELDKK
ncbi:MAG: dihydrolipoyl dehydrogenase, partial [Candidatus Omnitrophica bacterium]|nr:dihydrolipoyl dehydrogenase [Candidatus Omnitrophota bacterium]